MAVHFVGFRDGDQYHRAQKVWGPPDFIHRNWDVRAKLGGEFDSETDVFVFAKGTEHDTPSLYSFDDSAVF